VAPSGGRRSAARSTATASVPRGNGGSGPELVEQVLVERHQPALGDLATGDAEHPDGLPGPQLAVALQPAVGQMHRLVVLGQDGAWRTRKVTLAWARRAPK
jgi:hypothetical protein